MVHSDWTFLTMEQHLGRIKSNASNTWSTLSEVHQSPRVRLLANSQITRSSTYGCEGEKGARGVVLDFKQSISSSAYVWDTNILNEWRSAIWCNCVWDTIVSNDCRNTMWCNHVSDTKVPNEWKSAMWCKPCLGHKCLTWGLKCNVVQPYLGHKCFEWVQKCSMVQQCSTLPCINEVQNHNQWQTATFCYDPVHQWVTWLWKPSCWPYPVQQTKGCNTQSLAYGVGFEVPYKVKRHNGC